ncbi:hypothetical protein WJX79_000225 [Trebouxia sp. C0005]
MFKVTVHTHVSSTRPPDLLATGRACTKSTATKRQGTAQPIGCEDKEIHGSPRGAVNGKQGRLPDKSQKHRRGVLLKDSQDEVSDVCSPLVQLQQAAEAQNALSTNKRQRSRRKGVVRVQNSFKFRAYLKVDECQISLGSYSTEDEAARAVDEGLIYQGLAPVNFQNDLHPDDIGCAADNVDQYAKLKRFQARQWSKAQTTSRFKGVRKLFNQWECYMFRGRHITLGSYGSEEEAAIVHDEARIYQNLDPINFPHFPYNEDEIHQLADLSKFIELKRKQATQATKAGQSTRFTGVTWSALQKRWAVNLTIPTEQAGRTRCVFLGCFDTDEEAARVADKGRIRHGLKAVNFPDSQYDQHEIGQVADFGEQSRLEARRTVKARQHSRFTGVTWNKMVMKWEAYVYESYVKPNKKRGFKKQRLGYFASEEDAAKAADLGRIQNGQKAVNSKEMMGQ